MVAKSVLHLIETGGPGGAEQIMVHLADGLDPDYISEAALIRDGWLSTALRSRGVPVTMLRQGSDGSFAILRELLRLIRERGIAILHTHEFLMNTLGLVASGLTGVPVVATIHGRNYYSDRLRRRLAYRFVGRFAGQTIAVSEDVRDFLKGRVGIPADRIRVIPNGVPVDKVPSQEKILSLRKTLNIDANTKVVGTVGSLYPVKGHRYLINAVPHVVRRCPQTVFLIVGRGRLREELEAQAKSLGVSDNIHFLGHRDDVHDLLGLFDIFVLPSLSEGMPLALLEAMAAGLPAVATRVGGIPDVLQDGKTGLLVPTRDSTALADGIITILEDKWLAKEMGEAARQVVTRHFSVGRMIDDYKEIYARLIRKPQPVIVQR